MYCHCVCCDVSEVFVPFHKCTHLIPQNKGTAAPRAVQRTESQLYRLSRFIQLYYFELEKALGFMSVSYTPMTLPTT